MTKLAEALKKPDWQKNVDELLEQDNLIEAYSSECELLACWVLEFLKHDEKSPANPFAFQMLSASQHVIALASLGLYTPAAGSMRGLFESALYFLYFRKHPIELATLIRDPDFYVQKSEILIFFSKHIPEYQAKQQHFGLNSAIANWYKSVSSVVHAQIPGSWGGPKDLHSISQVIDSAKNIAAIHTQAVKIINQLFLLVMGADLWGSISPKSRKLFLKGYSVEVKKAIGLDILGSV